MEEDKQKEEKIIIKTDKSFLTFKKYKNKSLFLKCIEYVSDKLLINPPIIIFGKIGVQHRSIGFFSDVSIGYTYSGKLAKSQPLNSDLKKLLDDINLIYKADFNGILVNKYKDGNDNIGKHSDDEINLSNVGVVSLSYGTARKFRIRHKTDPLFFKTSFLDIPTEEYGLLHMGGKFQSEFYHEIPFEKKIKNMRISFTFRKHLK